MIILIHIDLTAKYVGFVCWMGLGIQCWLLRIVNDWISVDILIPYGLIILILLFFLLILVIELVIRVHVTGWELVQSRILLILLLCVSISQRMHPTRNLRPICRLIRLISQKVWASQRIWKWRILISVSILFSLALSENRSLYETALSN